MSIHEILPKLSDKEIATLLDKARSLLTTDSKWDNNPTHKITTTSTVCVMGHDPDVIDADCIDALEYSVSSEKSPVLIAATPKNMIESSLCIHISGLVQYIEVVWIDKSGVYVADMNLKTHVVDLTRLNHEVLLTDIIKTPMLFDGYQYTDDGIVPALPDGAILKYINKTLYVCVFDGVTAYYPVDGGHVYVHGNKE